MADQPTRRRRIVRRAVIAVAIVVLLPVWYVGSISCLMIVAVAGWMPKSVENSPVAVAYLAPATWYIESGQPGSDDWRELISWSQELGQRLRKE